MLISISDTRRVNLVRTGPRGGIPVVLVHPVGLDLTYWSSQIDALCDVHDVIAFDLPGHGLSPGTPEDWTLDKAAAVLAQVIRWSNASSAHVVGFSVGGMIAQALILAYPELAHSLTLIDTAASFPDAGRAAARKRAVDARQGGMMAVAEPTIERWFTEQTKVRRPDLIDRVTKTLLNDDPLIYAAMWDMLADLDLVANLEHIVCPTLILVGEHDPSAPLVAAELMQKRIAGSQLQVIADASHMAPLEKPAVINTRIKTFLAQHTFQE